MNMNNTKQKIWANFSVKDVTATYRFYSELGFTPNNTNNYPKLASFLFGGDNFVIHFFEQGSKINDFLNPASSDNREIIFTLSAETEDEVYAFAKKIEPAGGQIIKRVQRDEDNYFGFTFIDPDGHMFNVLLMDM